MFYDQLRQIRQRKGFKIREVAQRSGVSAAYISQIESGRRGTPSPDILLKLAEGLDSSYNELMEMAGYLSPKTEGAGEQTSYSLRHWLREHVVTLDGVTLSDEDKQWIEQMLTVMFDRKRQ